MFEILIIEKWDIFIIKVYLESIERVYFFLNIGKIYFLSLRVIDIVVRDFFSGVLVEKC